MSNNFRRNKISALIKDKNKEYLFPTINFMFQCCTSFTIGVRLRGEGNDTLNSMLAY